MGAASLYASEDSVSMIADIENGVGITQVPLSVGSQIRLMVWNASGATTADSGLSTTASYSGLDLGGAPSFGMATFSFTSGVSDSGSAVLIANPNGLLEVTDITDNSLHIVFTDTKCDAGYFNNGSPTIVQTFNYVRTLAKDGTKYRGGFSISGNTLTLYLPDGQVVSVTNAGFAANSGRYVQFESFTGSSAGIRATFHSVTFRRAA